MHKVLSLVDKALQRMQETEGSCETFGHYAMRVARAISIKRMVRKSTAGWNAGEYQTFTLVDGQYAIDRMIRDWQDAQKEKVAAD
jgi:hypothetical protein